MDLDKLKGQSLPYYGACENCFKLGDAVYEAIEDESDGYRSCMKEYAHITDPDRLKELIFLPNPIAIVEVRDAPDNANGDDRKFDGYEIVDAFINHRWALLGTDNSDDYYPSFYVNFTPLEPKTSYPLLTGGMIAASAYNNRIRSFPAAHGRRLRQPRKTKTEAPADTGYSDNPLFGSW